MIFFIQPYEIVFRSFSDSIRKMGKKYYYVRGKKLDNIIKELSKNKIFKITLGGCIIKKSKSNSNYIKRTLN